MVYTIPYKRQISEGEERTVTIAVDRDLDAGESLTGTPTVVELLTSDLTFASESINSAATDVEGRTIAIGKAVSFFVQGGVAGTTYSVQVTCSSNSSPVQVRSFAVELECV